MLASVEKGRICVIFFDFLVRFFVALDDTHTFCCVLSRAGVVALMPGVKLPGVGGHHG